MASWVDDGTSTYTVGDTAGRGFVGHEVLRRTGVGSLIVLPLAVAGERLGLLVLADRANRRPAPEDIELLELLALQAATGLRMASVLSRAARARLRRALARTTSANAPARAVTRSIPPTSSSPSQLNSVPGGSSTSITRPSIVRHGPLALDRLRPQPPRPPHELDPRHAWDPSRIPGPGPGVRLGCSAGTITTSRSPSSASAAPMPEPPPKAPVQATITCQASPLKTVSPSTRTPTSSGRPGERGAGGADRVGERAEARLQRLRAARGDRGQAGAGDVDERAPVGEPARARARAARCRLAASARGRRAGRAAGRWRGRSRSRCRRG